MGINSAMRALEITGQTFGRLTAMHREAVNSRHTYWRFACVCGTEKVIKLDSVTRGLSKSCGCLLKEVTASRSLKHGHSTGRRESRELKSYNHAKARCQNPNNAKYPQYGGRGIRMCDAWVNNSSLFLADMGPCPPGHTLDRINPHGHYEPGNCRWADSHQQARTRTDNVIVEHSGQRMILKDYAIALGLDYKRLHRLLRSGMSLADASRVPSK